MDMNDDLANENEQLRWQNWNFLSVLDLNKQSLWW